MSLTDQIARIMQDADLHGGVALWQIESDRRLDVNGGESFPMASVFKIPILATAGQQLAAGEIRLDERVPLRDEDKSLGSGILPYFEAGLQPTVRDLMTLMIIISDNTATDMMVDLLGGAAAIESAMHALGLRDIHFKLNCKQLLRHLFPADVADRPLEEKVAWSMEHDILRDSLAFSKGADNNVSTANSMNELLHMMHSGACLGDGERELAFEILDKQQFKQRMPRFLPLGVQVANKTGTIGGIRNDSGIMKIAEDNHVIVTMFMEWDEAPCWDKPQAHHQRVYEVETAMGKIGLAAYEAFSADN